MKFVFIALGILCAWPLSFQIERSRTLRSFLWVLVGIIPFVATFVNLQPAVIPWEEWKGHTYGLDVGLIDIIALSFFLARKRGRNIPFPHLVFLLFTAALSLSVFQAEEPLASIFYIWQFVRLYFLAYVIALYSDDDSVPLDILKGAAIALSCEALLVIYQRIVLGVTQPPGTFSHQNVLGFSGHFVMFPCFALVLAGRKEFQAFVGPLAALLIAAFSASRGTIGLGVAGLALTYGLLALCGMTTRKATVALAGLVIAAAMVPVVLGSFQAREMMGTNPWENTDYDERAAFEKTASLILSDYPLGVGTNLYSYVAFNQGYSLMGGVFPDEANLSAMVHNAFYLTAAETGYFGLVAFILLLGYPAVACLYWGWMGRRSARGELLLGFFVTFVAVNIHSTVEWIFYNRPSQYLFALAFGMAMGLARTVKEQVAEADPSRPHAAQGRPLRARMPFPLPQFRLPRRHS